MTAIPANNTLRKVGECVEAAVIPADGQSRLTELALAIFGMFKLIFNNISETIVKAFFLVEIWNGIIDLTLFARSLAKVFTPKDGSYIWNRTWQSISMSICSVAIGALGMLRFFAKVGLAVISKSALASITLVRTFALIAINLIETINCGITLFKTAGKADKVKASCGFWTSLVNKADLHLKNPETAEAQAVIGEWKLHVSTQMAAWKVHEKSNDKYSPAIIERKVQQWEKLVACTDLEAIKHYAQKRKEHAEAKQTNNKYTTVKAWITIAVSVSCIAIFVLGLLITNPVGAVAFFLAGLAISNAALDLIGYVVENVFLTNKPIEIPEPPVVFTAART